MARLSGSPSSRPHDHATLAHFAGNRDDCPIATASQGDNDLPDTGSERLISITPSVDSDLQKPPSESTHLLAPPIPCVDESVERESGGRTTMAVIREEAKILGKYALPVFGTQVFEHSILMTSVIAIGHISTIALAAATLGYMTANVSGLSIIQGMASTLDTILPSAWTSGQPQLVGLWTQRMVVLQLILLIPIYVIWLNGEALLLALKQDPEVAGLAGIYLKWATLCLPAYAFNCISRRYFQAQGLFDVPARIITCVAPINVLLNYLLVWGPDSIRLGFIGAPIAISISYNLISLASIVYGIFFVKKTAWHPITTRCLTSLGPLAWLCLGSIGQFSAEWWSWELVGLAASFLGPVSLAAQSILLTTTSCAFQAPYALGIATSVRIGNLLGEKKAKRAGLAASIGLLLALVLALVIGGFLLTFRMTWGYFFNNDPEVVALVAAVLPLVALVHIPDDCTAVIAGILRARGKQTLGAILNITAYYVFGCPFGLWLTFKLQLGLYGLWWGLNFALTIAAAVGIYLCLTTDWQKEVEKVMARLEFDKAYQRARDEEYTQQCYGTTYDGVENIGVASATDDSR